MAWHPRLNTDPRHVWLRGALRSMAAALAVWRVCLGTGRPHLEKGESLID